MSTEVKDPKRRSKIQIDPNNRIVIKGAREHNLKNVDLTLPRNKLIVMTGLSDVYKRQAPGRPPAPTWPV